MSSVSPRWPREQLPVRQRLFSHFLPALGENVDLVAIVDDLGTQASLPMSPKMYRAILKPIHADLFALILIKSHTRAKLFFHSDGDVLPLIDDLVEIGVDSLNPIQTSAGKMSELATLKRRYGRDLSFSGPSTPTASFPEARRNRCVTRSAESSPCSAPAAAIWSPRSTPS